MARLSNQATRRAKMRAFAIVTNLTLVLTLGGSPILRRVATVPFIRKTFAKNGWKLANKALARI